LTIEYQPSFDLQTLRPVSLEALLRWRTADGTYIPPSRFIPIAEQSGLIVDIGDWVLRTVGLQLSEWQRQHVPLLPVSNYSIRVESQGFQTTEQKDLRLQVNEQREVDFALNPASVSSTVEVSATEVAVQTTNATLGQVITSEQVADLPLNGRDFVQLTRIIPGVQRGIPGANIDGAGSLAWRASASFSAFTGYLPASPRYRS